MTIDWEGALCREVGMPDLWFSDDPEDKAAAKEVCGRCPLRERCLEFATANGEEYGIWGGVEAPFRPKVSRQQLQSEMENRADVARSLYRAGLSIEDIKKRLGLSRRTICGYLGDLCRGGTLEARTQRSAERRVEARSLARAGYKNAEISQMMGVAHSTISKYLAE